MRRWFTAFWIGSFFIDFIVPSAAAFTTVVSSDCISIPVCVVHSFNVSEYIRFSLLYSFIISPSTGFTKLGSGIITGASCFFTSGAFVSVFGLLSVFASVLFSVLLSVFVSSLFSILFSLVLFSSFFDSSTVFPIELLASS